MRPQGGAQAELDAGMTATATRPERQSGRGAGGRPPRGNRGPSARGWHPGRRIGSRRSGCRARPAPGSTPRRSGAPPRPRAAPPARAGRRWPTAARLPWAINKTAVRSDRFDGAGGSPGGSIGASFRVVRARSDSMVRGGRVPSIFGGDPAERDETIDPRATSVSSDGEVTHVDRRSIQRRRGLADPAGCGLGAGAAAESAFQVPQDDEDAAYREAMARKSLQEYCLICHTEDLIAGQRLTPTREGRGDKMVTGARPLPGVLPRFHTESALTISIRCAAPRFGALIQAQFTIDRAATPICRT